MGIKSNRHVLVRLVTALICFGSDLCSAKNVSALFIFGDSLVEAGNNFYIKTVGQALYPNGIDFGTNAMSGRYTNGRTVADIIGQKLGFKKFIPPYLDPTTIGDVILKGVNFASATSGIIESTGNSYGEHIPLDRQIEYFTKIRQDIIMRIGSKSAKKLIEESLFIIATGGNDVSTAASYNSVSSQEAYLGSLVAKFRSQLATLYALDARKLVVTGVGKIGCLPYVRERSPGATGCVPIYNLLAKSYNAKLKRLLRDLNANLRGSKFLYANNYAILEDLVDNFVTYGFEDADNACCSVLRGGLSECIPISSVCSDRRKFVFWDAFHLTEASNLIVAQHLMEGGPEFIWPMNIRQLFALKKSNRE